MARILLVDDDKNNLSALARVLRQIDDIEIERFESAGQALERAREATFDLVISDYRMPEMDGARFLEAFRQLQPHAYRIIISGYADRELLQAAINRAQIHRFIEKPGDGFLIAHAVQEGLQQTSLHHEVTALRDELERLQQLLQGVADKAPELLPENWQQPAEKK